MKSRDIKIHIGAGPMAETVEKVLAELILKASINKANRLNGVLSSEPKSSKTA